MLNWNWFCHRWCRGSLCSFKSLNLKGKLVTGKPHHDDHNGVATEMIYWLLMGLRVVLCASRKVSTSLNSSHLKSKPLSPFQSLICAAGVWRRWLVPQLYVICRLLYEKHSPLKFILHPKPHQLIDTQTKLRELHSAALIDGRTWKVACLLPLCDCSIKPWPLWLAVINMHGDSLSPLYSAPVWSNTAHLFFFAYEGAICLPTSEHCKSVPAAPLPHQSVQESRRTP